MSYQDKFAEFVTTIQAERGKTYTKVPGMIKALRESPLTCRVQDEENDYLFAVEAAYFMRTYIQDLKAQVERLQVEQERLRKAVRDLVQ